MRMEPPRDIKEAKRIQLELRRKVKIAPLKKDPRLIAGVDAAFIHDKIIAAACLYEYPELMPVEDAFAVGNITFPYIPGYLSFREGPAVIEVVNKLSRKPDLILFDGQGIAHPSGMGIAAHVGVLLGMPSIGCAKSRLVGDYVEPGHAKGKFTKLVYKRETVGAVLRTRDNVKPLFISPGHLTDLKDAIRFVLACTDRYRLPEPLRKADALSKALKNDLRI